MKNNILENVGSTLKELRVLKGVTQSELGKLSGKPQSTIARIESGITSDVSLRVVFELIDAMDVSLSEFGKALEGKELPSKSVKLNQSKKELDLLMDKVDALDPKNRKKLLSAFHHLIETFSS